MRGRTRSKLANSSSAALTSLPPLKPCRFRLWLLSKTQDGTLPLSVYLVADTVAGWPINVTLIAFTTWFPLRALRRAGFMTLAPREISPIDAAELAVEESAPTTV